VVVVVVVVVEEVVVAAAVVAVVVVVAAVVVVVEEVAAVVVVVVVVVVVEVVVVVVFANLHPLFPAFPRPRPWPNSACWLTRAPNRTLYRRSIHSLSSFHSQPFLSRAPGRALRDCLAFTDVLVIIIV